VFNRANIKATDFFSGHKNIHTDIYVYIYIYVYRNKDGAAIHTIDHNFVERKLRTLIDNTKLQTCHADI
jgi:hypothetical protein